MESAKKLGVIQSKSEDVIRRGKTLDDGFYVSGKFEKVDVMFTIDTGASKTMISEECTRRSQRIQDQNYYKPHHSGVLITQTFKNMVKLSLKSNKEEKSYSKRS